ncbi:MAG: BREX system ATP-binding domain-containing protein [Streptosporangiaceae bacterium]
MTTPVLLTDEQVARRRAVEALRSGVPSWDAVAMLGSGQPEAEDGFVSLLDRVASRSGGGVVAEWGDRGSPGADRRGQAGRSRGLLLGGGFGGGKSHLLTHFGHLAMSAGFVVSTVVISKETPLHDPAKTFRAAIDAAVDPGQARGALASAAALLDPDTPRYAELTRWVNSPASGLDERFAATLLCHERLRGGDAPGSDETAEALVRFWSGEPLRMTDLRRTLRSVGAAGLFTFSPLSARDLARQRFKFAAALLRAAGHDGWVILFDEVELIGRYSLLQRGRSYAELDRWLGGHEGDRSLPLAAVFAMTDDFEAAVLTGKNDRDDIPGKLRAKQTPEWDETATLAEAGMRRIENDMILLEPPGDAELDRTYAALKKLHGDAFGWSPPDVAGLERLGATRMRQYVRAWINEWDLLRLDPEFRPQTVAVDIATNYREDSALEESAVEDARDPTGADEAEGSASEPE